MQIDGEASTAASEWLFGVGAAGGGTGREGRGSQWLLARQDSTRRPLRYEPILRQNPIQALHAATRIGVGYACRLFSRGKNLMPLDVLTVRPVCYIGKEAGEILYSSP